MIPLKKPLPGEQPDNGSTKNITAETVSAKTAIEPSDGKSASASSATSRRIWLIIIVAIIAIATGVYFLFFNKSKNYWEEDNDADLWESETEAVNNYEDF